MCVYVPLYLYVTVHIVKINTNINFYDKYFRKENVLNPRGYPHYNTSL